MAPPQTVTKTATSVDYTTYAEVKVDSGSDGPSSFAGIGHQVCRVGCNMNASGTCTIKFVLMDATSVKKVITCTVADSGTRAARTGASGDYVGTVTATNNDWIDLFGHDYRNVGSGLRWYVGLSALATATSVDIFLWPSRSI